MRGGGARIEFGCPGLVWSSHDVVCCDVLAGAYDSTAGLAGEPASSFATVSLPDVELCKHSWGAQQVVL